MADPISLPAVWIVEDHDLLRATLAEIIEESGTGTATTFDSCEAALASDAPAPDAIVLDLGLSGMSGIAGIRLFKERFPATEIVMFTVFDDREKTLRSSLRRCLGLSPEVRITGAHRCGRPRGHRGRITDDTGDSPASSSPDSVSSNRPAAKCGSRSAKRKSCDALSRA